MSKENDLIDDDLYDEDGEDTQKDRYFTFRVGEEEYGIEIMHVLEVVGLQKITEVPDMPDFVKGVINLRGQVIPIMDVRTRFGMETVEYDDRTCVLVVNMQEQQIGLIVDKVSDVLDIPESQVQPPPKVTNRPGSRYISGLGKVNEEVKILLDVQKLLYEEEMAQVASAV